MPQARLRLFRYFLPLIGALAQSSVAVAAQPAPPDTVHGPLSLRAAIDYALTHQPQLLAARERLRAAQADAEVPGAQWQPSVGAMAEIVGATANNSTTTLLSSRQVDLPRIGGTSVSSKPSFRPYPSSAVAVGVRQELFDFGRIAAQTAAANALVATERERLRGARLDTAFAVAEGYYAVRAAHAVLDVATQAEERARLHRDYALAQVNSGLRSPIERTRAEADLTRFEVNRIKAEGGLRVAEGVFAAAVGFPAPELDALPEPDRAFTLPSRGEVRARASAADPAVLEALAQSRAQRSLTQAIAASERPNLSATAAVSGRAGGAPASNRVTPEADGWLPEVPNYSAGVLLEWPLYDGVTRSRVVASERRERALSAEVDVRRQQAVTRAELAYRNAEAALLALDALTRSAEAARSNHQQAEARFQSGLGTSVELADAEMLMIDAEIQLAIGKFQLGVQRAALARTMTEER